MCPSSQQPCFQSCQLTSLHCPSIHCQPSSPFSSLFCSQVLSKDPKSPPTVARGKHQCELIPEQFEKRVRSAEPAGVLTPTLCHSVTLTLPLGARKSQSQSISPHPAFLTMDSSNSSINNVSFFVLITSMYSPYLLIPWALSQLTRHHIPVSKLWLQPSQRRRSSTRTPKCKHCRKLCAGLRMN